MTTTECGLASGSLVPTEAAVALVGRPTSIQMTADFVATPSCVMTITAMLMPHAPIRPGRSLAHVTRDMKEMALSLAAEAQDARISTNVLLRLITATTMPRAKT